MSYARDVAQLYDAAVIGAGHNGLACAAYLARAGLSTLVLEARDSVGGCASTVPAVGARVNICNCDHIMVRATPLIDELELAHHGLRYLEVDPAFLHLTWDGDQPWFLYRDPDRTVAELARQNPRDAGAYRRYLTAALPAARLIARLAGSPPRPRAVIPAILAAGGRAAFTIWRWCERSALDVLSDFFDSERLITPALTTGPAVWGVPVDAPGTGLAALGYALRHVVGVGRPVGGSGARSRPPVGPSAAPPRSDVLPVTRAASRLKQSTGSSGLLGWSRPSTHAPSSPTCSARPHPQSRSRRVSNRRSTPS